MFLRFLFVVITSLFFVYAAKLEHKCANPMHKLQFIYRTQKNDPKNQQSQFVEKNICKDVPWRVPIYHGALPHYHAKCPCKDDVYIVPTEILHTILKKKKSSNLLKVENNPPPNDTHL